MTTVSPSPDSSDLQKLVREFTLWRKKRSHLRSPVPIQLRQQAVSLLPHYPIAQLINALGVTRQMLKQWREDMSNGDENSTESPFITVMLPKDPEPVVSAVLPVDLTLTLPQPNQIHIQGYLSLPQLTAIMRGLGVTGEPSS